MRALTRRLASITVLAVVLGACSAPPADEPIDEPVVSGSQPHAQHSPASPVLSAPLRDGERFVDLAIERPYTPAPPKGGTDEYRCFLIDPGFAEPAFITGSHFRPDNLQILHHAIFFRVPPEDVAQAQRMDQTTDGDGWTCFGGTGIGSGNQQLRQLASGSAWIAAWAPGGAETVIGGRNGYQMEAGSQIVMQVHYSTLALDGQPAPPDRSGVRLRVADGSAAIKPLQTTLLPGAVELPCLPTESGSLCDRTAAVMDVWSRFGERAAATVAGLNLLCNGGKDPSPGPVQSCEHRVRETGTVYAVAGHMHLLGRSIKVELNPGTAKAKVLLDVPVYNFDEQGARPLAKPVQIKAGDVLRVTCTHDASLRDQLPQLSKLEPRYVVWGDGTSDEMCLGIVTWTR